MPEFTAPPANARARLFRHSTRDAGLVAAALVQGALLVAAGAAFEPRARAAWIPVAVGAVGIGVWWGSNTVSHIHLHTPLFRAHGWNRAFSLFLTALFGVPQSIWRARHLAHHAGPAGEARAARRPGLPRGAPVEIALVIATFAAMALARPAFFLAAWLPGYLLGMLLCQAQGVFEHAGAGPVGISFYGPLYNRLWWNDGYHAEHHRRPDEHWSRLPSLREAGANPVSGLPPIARGLGPLLRRMKARALDALERLALASPRLGRFMVATHARAFARLLPIVERERPIRRVCIVGGGLFPRTALVLASLRPEAALTLLDRKAAHLDAARAFLAAHAPGIEVELREADLAAAADLDAFDLVVLPLALDGDAAPATRRAGPAILAHEWIWRRRGRAGVVISPLLLKRLNLA